MVFQLSKVDPCQIWSKYLKKWGSYIHLNTKKGWKNDLFFVSRHFFRYSTKTVKYRALGPVPLDFSHSCAFFHISGAFQISFLAVYRNFGNRRHPQKLQRNEYQNWDLESLITQPFLLKKAKTIWGMETTRRDLSIETNQKFVASAV